MIDNSTVNRPVLILGNRGGSNVGESFARACSEIGIPFLQIESDRAMRGSAVLRRVIWHLWDHQPIRLRRHSAEIVDLCRARRPSLVLAMGIAPLTAEALEEIGNLGCCRANYLTDDPWNPRLGSRWFSRALPHYDHVFTTRRANIDDLVAVGIHRVSYLAFGWDPSLFPDKSYSERDLGAYDADVMFAGDGDQDRVPYIAALTAAGLRVAVYGSYWERFAETRQIARGRIAVTDLPKAIMGARIALCLVRRGNRDGHCMRTFEVPAAGGCMLTENTEEHREIFGQEGERVLYFRTVDEMIAKAKWLLEDATERTRLAAAARAHIRTHSNTYEQRLISILDSIDGTEGALGASSLGHWAKHDSRSSI